MYSSLPRNLLLIGAVVVLTVGTAYATTYYVDNAIGADTNSGTTPTTSGNSGPWKSLARVKTAPLSPGDTILLKCGQRWAETLGVGQSGTETAPITITSYPAACENKPAIDGSINVPASAWQNVGNGTFTTNYPFQLISNGTFSTGLTGWTMWSENKVATVSAATGSCSAGKSPCLQLNGAANTGHGLISSPAFSLEGSREYIANISVNIPAGKWIRLTLRRNSAPWEAIAQTNLVGNGAWTEIEMKTNSKSSIDSARFDIEFSGSIIAHFDDVKVTPTLSEPKALYSSGKWQNIAHYPNQGSIPARPDSHYFLTAGPSDRVLRSDGRTYGSTYIVLDPLNNGLNTAGVAGDTRLYVRTTPWKLEEFSVTRIEGNRAYLDSASSYPIEKGFGFFFTGSPWMLNEEEEWLYNRSAKTVTYRPKNTAPPAGTVVISELAVGADLTGRANIVLDNLRLTNIEVGVIAMNSNGIKLLNSVIANTSREGVLMSGARSIVIRNNEIRNIGRDAISGYRTTSNETTYAEISDNVISGSGLHLHNGEVVSIPTPNRAAIYSAFNSNVARNRIENTAYNAIYPGPNSVVHENTIKNSCILLDDCAGVYVFGSNHRTIIEKNHIENLIGTIDGITRTYPHAVGVYLDELSSEVTVRRNTVINAAYGIQLHNAFNNLITENTLFGNRIYQIWLQEGSRIVDSAGDLHSNEITGNKIFSTLGTYGVSHDTNFGTTQRFASYDYNLHSGLINQYIARESMNNNETAFTFAAWQAITVRQSDPNGTEVKPTGYASFAVRDYNVFASSSNSADGWASWSSVPPRPVVMAEPYAGASGISLQANAAPSLLSSSNFSVKKDRWYRVSFDVASSQTIRFEVAGRRGGGGTNGYEFLAENSTRVFSNTSWKKFSFTFKSKATVTKDDPVTLDNGARIDFQNVPPGVKLYVKDVEVVEVAPVGTSLITAILSNDSAEPKIFDCPEEGVAANACGYFVNFDGSAPVEWPYTAAPLESIIVYTKDTSLQDIDGDGIADVQDSCANSPQGEFVNARGCGRLQ
ncbi:carbohydrate binding domain-containing protein [Methyloversatilis sp.]|uniref:carbohydrate binding domain-containing protein n=1 Tax=Methyloversatilis sp. TaxID=2569862 RepID=UPI002735AAAC|nr:carbohydrate binding domain-containing protein [Methyloversatilis sp.]MDP3455950.1 carbohydrate binding domain-containing protein [Methyloversatilis sp.]